MNTRPLLSQRQTRLTKIFIAVLFAVSTILFVAVGRAQTGVAPSTRSSLGAASGEWTAQSSRKQVGKIQLNFTRRTATGNSMNGRTMAISDLQGLTADAIESASSNVKFDLVREAGTITCEGTFTAGRGSGTWTFSPNQSFVSAMSSRGFNNLSDEDIVRAAFNNVSTKYADELKSAGYDKLDFQGLMRASNHDISPRFIRELGDAGYASLSMEELIRASNHDIDASFINEVRGMGFDKQTLEQMIRLKNHDITQEFVVQMKTVGFAELTPASLIRLKNHDVTAQFVNDIKAEGYSGISVETAIRLKNHDVDREVIRRAKAQGYSNATLEELVRLRSRGTIK